MNVVVDELKVGIEVRRRHLKGWRGRLKVGVDDMKVGIDDMKVGIEDM